MSKFFRKVEPSFPLRWRLSTVLDHNKISKQ